MTAPSRSSGSEPLTHAKLELYAVERAAGLDEEQATIVSGLPFFYGRQPREVTSKRRSPIIRQALRRLDARIKVLDALSKISDLDESEKLRHLRASAELRWARAVLQNNGVEPDEWAADEDDENTTAATAARRNEP